MQKALKEKGIDSMLEDARNDMKDTDTEHMKRGCKFPSLYNERIV